MPGGKRAFVVESAFDLDHGCRPEIGPRELLPAGPAQGDGAARRLGQACRFNPGLARVFAAETAAEVGHHNAHLVLAEVKGPRQFGPAAERVLGPGPNGELALDPFGDRRTGFQGCMLNVGHLVGLP